MSPNMMTKAPRAGLYGNVRGLVSKKQKKKKKKKKKKKTKKKKKKKKKKQKKKNVGTSRTNVSPWGLLLTRKPRTRSGGGVSVAFNQVIAALLQRCSLQAVLQIGTNQPQPWRPHRKRKPQIDFSSRAYRVTTPHERWIVFKTKDCGKSIL